MPSIGDWKYEYGGDGASICRFERYWYLVGAVGCRGQYPEGNMVKSDSLLQETSNRFLHPTHLIVTTVSVVDLIVVESKDTVLVVHKDNVQDVKTYFNKWRPRSATSIMPIGLSVVHGTFMTQSITGGVLTDEADHGECGSSFLCRCLTFAPNTGALHVAQQRWKRLRTSIWSQKISQPIYRLEGSCTWDPWNDSAGTYRWAIG